MVPLGPLDATSQTVRPVPLSTPLLMAPSSKLAVTLMPGPVLPAASGERMREVSQDGSLRYAEVDSHRMHIVVVAHSSAQFVLAGSPQVIAAAVW